MQESLACSPQIPQDLQITDHVGNLLLYTVQTAAVREEVRRGDCYQMFWSNLGVYT